MLKECLVHVFTNDLVERAKATVTVTNKFKLEELKNCRHIVLKIGKEPETLIKYLQPKHFENSWLITTKRRKLSREATCALVCKMSVTKKLKHFRKL